MKLMINIPKEFECDFAENKFEDFFSRVICDMKGYKGLCGNYEEETACMFIDVFADAELLNNDGVTK